MADPIEGRLGSLVMSGWISPTPDTGRDGAFALLTTPDSRASATMPLIAETLGFDSTWGAITEKLAADTWVTLETRRGEAWATVHVPGGETFARPVSAEWAELARAYNRVIFVIGFASSRSGEAAEAYTDRVMSSAQFTLGIVPVR